MKVKLAAKLRMWSVARGTGLQTARRVQGDTADPVEGPLLCSLSFGQLLSLFM